MVPQELIGAMCWPTVPPKVEKVWQTGNLVIRKFLKNQALAENFWILLLHFLTIRQIRGSVKEMISAFLENGHILDPLFYKIPESNINFLFCYINALSCLGNM